MNISRLTGIVFAALLNSYRKRRFQNFTLLCENTDLPPVRYPEGSWVKKQVTQDQLRIGEYLQNQNLENATLLHVGVGSSAIAKQFSAIAYQIDGISVVQGELDYAISLNMPNYRLFQYNKYGCEIMQLRTQYDYIIDNNLTSYACCINHFQQMLNQYLQLVKPTGKIITDINGLRHYINGFGLTEVELKKWENILPMKVNRVSGYILVINKTK